MARRLLTLSLFALGVFAVGVAAQPPAEKKAAEKKAPPPDTALEAALANDPDVRTARAKIQLAEAELAKARQVVVAKVLTLRSAIVSQQKAVALAEEGFALVQAGFAAKQISRAELLLAREKLEVTTAALAKSETELKLITDPAAGGFRHAANVCPAATKGNANCAACHSGVGSSPEAVVKSDLAARLDYAAYLDAMHKQFMAKASGPIPDRLRAALNKTVKLGEKNEQVTFGAALEAFKKVGLDVPVRVVMKMPSVVSQGEELAVGAWLQMYADEAGDCLMLVRDYGLLVTGKSHGPPTDAASVFDLWKQKLVEPKK